MHVNACMFMHVLWLTVGFYNHYMYVSNLNVFFYRVYMVRIKGESNIATVRYFKGELLGKNEVILDVWSWNHVSIFDNFIYQ